MPLAQKTLILLFACTLAKVSHASPGAVIFYLDERYEPVVKLERIRPLTEDIKAILAVYALQNGAGCSGKNDDDTLNCLMAERLGVGALCSEKHFDLIRKHFKNKIPQMSGFGKQFYNIKHLKDICYNAPSGASIEDIWDLIRLSQDGDLITIDAHGSWHVRDDSGKFKYITKYKINNGSIDVVSHKKVLDSIDP